MLTLVTLALLTVTVLQGRDPRVVYRERRQAVLSRAAEARAYVGRLVGKGTGEGETQEEEEEEEAPEEEKKQELQPEKGRFRGMMDSVTSGAKRAGSATIHAIHSGVTVPPRALGDAAGKVIKTTASGITGVASGVTGGIISGATSVSDVGKAAVYGVAGGATSIVGGAASIVRGTATGVKNLSVGGARAVGHVITIPGGMVSSALGRGKVDEAAALKCKGDKLRAKQLKMMAKGCGCSLAAKSLFPSKYGPVPIQTEAEAAAAAKKAKESSSSGLAKKSLDSCNHTRGSKLSWFGKPQSEKTMLAGHDGKPVKEGEEGSWVPIDWEKYRQKIGNCYDTVTGKTSEEKQRSIEKCREKVADEMKAEEKRKKKEAAEKRKREAEAARAKREAEAAAAKAKKAQAEAEKKAEEHKKKAAATAK